MAEKSCEMYGYKPNPQLHEIFTKYHKTHNQGVFDIYTPEMLKARHNKILTGLPDTYGRGRIVGDYRRVALYGIDYLIEKKKADFTATNRQGMRRGDFQLREEIADQVRCFGYCCLCQHRCRCCSKQQTRRNSHTHYLQHSFFHTFSPLCQLIVKSAFSDFIIAYMIFI